MLDLRKGSALLGRRGLVRLWLWRLLLLLLLRGHGIVRRAALLWTIGMRVRCLCLLLLRGTRGKVPLRLMVLLVVLLLRRQRGTWVLAWRAVHVLRRHVPGVRVWPRWRVPAVGRQRGRHARLKQSLVIPAGFDEFLVELRKIVCPATG